MFQGLKTSSLRRPKYSSSKSMIVYPTCAKIEEDDFIIEPKEDDKIPFVYSLERSNSVKLLVSQIESKTKPNDKSQPDLVIPIFTPKDTLMNKLLNMNKYKTNI